MISPRTLTHHTIPLRSYLLITLLFYSTNLTNNLALSYSVDMPTLLVFRSGSLLANMLVSLVAFRRSYPPSKYLAVLMVTAGIVVATSASAGAQASTAQDGGFLTWTMGIAMLTYALLGSAVMGVFQERLFAEYGKKPEEVLFFSHLLGLPAFLLNYRDIVDSIGVFTASAPITIAGLQIPSLWLMILVNVALQNACVKGVYFLLSEWSSLSVTMVTTLRKFISLLLSIYIFQNPFTPTHWIGTALVFAGSALFSGILRVPRFSSSSKTE